MRFAMIANNGRRHQRGLWAAHQKQATQPKRETCKELAQKEKKEKEKRKERQKRIKEKTMLTKKRLLL